MNNDNQNNGSDMINRLLEFVARRDPVNETDSDSDSNTGPIPSDDSGYESDSGNEEPVTIQMTQEEIMNQALQIVNQETDSEEDTDEMEIHELPEEQQGTNMDIDPESEVQFQTIKKLVYQDNLEPSYGCKHYLRRCELFAECCQTFYLCRLCHDEKELTMQNDFTKKHQMDRHAVTKIRCTECQTIQPVSDRCQNQECSIRFGNYYCKECRLYDDIDKDQYHCDKCGLCRINKKNMDEHCDTCGICQPKGEHHCISEVGESECPFCFCRIKESTKPFITLRCGHVTHHGCLLPYLQKDYRCPVCQKAIVNLEPINQQIQLQVNMNQMPEEYQRKATIYCIECEETNEADFHFVAMKCPNCGCFNTRE